VGYSCWGKEKKTWISRPNTLNEEKRESVVHLLLFGIIAERRGGGGK